MYDNIRTGYDTILGKYSNIYIYKYMNILILVEGNLT